MHNLNVPWRDKKKYLQSNQLKFVNILTVIYISSFERDFIFSNTTRTGEIYQGDG